MADRRGAKTAGQSGRGVGKAPNGGGRRVYWATVSSNGRIYGVSFVDFPGCIASEDTYEAAIASAHAALEFHTRGKALPKPASRDQVERIEAADNEGDDVLTYVPIVLKVALGAAFKVRVHGPDGDMHYIVPGDVQAMLVRMLAPYRDGVEGAARAQEFMDAVAAASGGKAAAMLAGSRGKYELTQKAVAEAVGIDASHISAMERGRRKVSPRIAQRLAKVLKCDWRELVSE